MKINFVATSIDELNTFRSLVEFSEFNISPTVCCTFSPIELDKICSGINVISYTQTDSSSMDCIEVYLSEPSNRLTNGLSDNLYISNDLALLLQTDSTKTPSVKQLFTLHKSFTFFKFKEEITCPDQFEPFDYIQIEHIIELLEDPRDNKLLITSNRQLVEVMLATSHSRFVHLLLQEDTMSLCLAVDHFKKQLSNLHDSMAIINVLSNEIKGIDSRFFNHTQELLKRVNTSYSFFSNLYDDYMSHVDYDLWVQKILYWVKEYSSLNCRNILEIACGTANISSKLTSLGYNVAACDKSASMLRIARQKLSRPNLYRATMTDCILPAKYDLILCMFDSVNYLLTDSDFTLMLNNVYASLNEGGLFIFDISTIANSIDNFNDVCNVTIDGDILLTHEAYYNHDLKRQISRLHLFEKRYHTFIHSFEQHDQRVYLCKEIIDFISSTKFNLCAVHNPDIKSNFYPKNMNQIDKKNHRLFFILSK